MSPEGMTSALHAIERSARRPDRRLDPFVFPSETRGRFRMLLVAALLIGINAGSILVMRVDGPDFARRMVDFAIRAGEVTQHRDPRELTPDQVVKLSRELPPLAWEMLLDQGSRLFTPLLFGLFLLGFARVLYVLHPRRIRRRHGSQPLATEQAPTVVSFLRHCTETLSLPQLEVETATGLAEAQTFGVRGKEVLLLHGTPDLLEKTWGDTAKTIVLHEIGHVVNGDAQEREKSRAIWIALSIMLALIFFAMGPFALAGVARAYLERGAEAAHSELTAVIASLLWAALHLAPSLLLSGLIWAGLVRTRELYADRRVASWGRGGVLDRMLSLRERRNHWWEHSQWWGAGWERWGHIHTWRQLANALEAAAKPFERIWRRHPSYRLRRQALTEPWRLFRVSSDLPFVTGFLLSLLIVNLLLPMIELAMSLSLLSSIAFYSTLAPFSASLPAPWDDRVFLSGALAVGLAPTMLFISALLGVLSHLVTRSLGIQVQREAIYDLAEQRPREWGYLKLLRPAFLLALGLEAGFRVTPVGVALRLPIEVPLQLLWLAGMTCFIWLWLAYVRALARFTLGMHGGHRAPHRLRALATGATVTLLVVLYWPAGFARLVFMLSRFTLPPWLIGTADPHEHFIYLFVMTGVLLAVFAIVAYLVWAGATFAFVVFRLFRWDTRCAFCGEPVERGFTVGRSCSSCGEQLAAWAFESDSGSIP